MVTVVHGPGGKSCLGQFVQEGKAFVEEYAWLPHEKSWVNLLANNRERAERLGFEIDLAVHWLLTQTRGCLTPCVICDALENDEAFAAIEAADENEPAQTGAAARQVQDSQPCLRCWTQGAEARWEHRQSELVWGSVEGAFW
jgi:hypothetical protein